ncbi:MAG TPA: PilN domain-containing protein [Burkholderiales bacterium]|jgi:Tfp pilus assembly protein PilN|nr:PilN domain-containing protein [Burkholderiales bacterium]
MQRLELDFLHPRGRWYTPGTVLLALGLLIAGLTAGKFQDLASEQAVLQAQIGDTQRLLRREVPRVQSDDKQLNDQVARANVVLSALNLPWDAMFRELEAASNENMALLAIQPESAGRRVRLAGEARRYDDLLAYVSRLEQTKGFANVYLLSHQALEGATTGAVSFALVADWAGL